MVAVVVTEVEPPELLVLLLLLRSVIPRRISLKRTPLPLRDRLWSLA